MTRVVLTLLGLILAGPALAGTEMLCQVPEGLVQADFAMPRVAAALAAKRLEVAVIGSASSALVSPGGAGKSYPSRLETALVADLPGVAVRVSTYAKPRQSAAEMQREIAGILATQKPALVVWQTGTADAIRGVDPDEFRTALEEGVDALQAGGADIILMNMQFSPRTESMIALSSYADVMRFVAMQHSVNLFDRFAVMKHWNEAGVFDLNAATKKLDMAEQVHDCFGRLLSRLVVEGAALTRQGEKAND
ncbi:MAG: SGNH/GDSL hydrolase family protein [Rhodoplanes sp.]|uniref:SGNH/GDSL hydrolase family protein n=1 Tax=Rhodoplanes sp. TaxID=1968906 RepID=UPI00185C04D3|nr:GDSL-type esterase/lipase family protein [Rhodoplanes sp.]NVO14535.1 SGNH/GDSL hydrolase family protein [Rhodoplanes sp.]